MKVDRGLASLTVAAVFAIAGTVGAYWYTFAMAKDFIREQCEEQVLQMKKKGRLGEYGLD